MTFARNPHLTVPAKHNVLAVLGGSITASCITERNWIARVYYERPLYAIASRMSLRLYRTDL